MYESAINMTNYDKIQHVSFFLCNKNNCKGATSGGHKWFYSFLFCCQIRQGLLLKQPCCSSACFQNRFSHVAYTLCGLDSKLAVVDWTSMDFFFFSGWLWVVLLSLLGWSQAFCSKLDCGCQLIQCVLEPAQTQIKDVEIENIHLNWLEVLPHFILQLYLTMQTMITIDFSIHLYHHHHHAPICSPPPLYNSYLKSPPSSRPL